MIPSDDHKALIHRFNATVPILRHDATKARAMADRTIARVSAAKDPDMRCAGLMGTFYAMLSMALNRIDELEAKLESAGSAGGGEETRCQ